LSVRRPLLGILCTVGFFAGLAVFVLALAHYHFESGALIAGSIVMSASVMASALARGSGKSP
jgi:hypothetical protein